MAIPAGRTWFGASMTINSVAINNPVKITVPSLSTKVIEFDTLNQTGNWSQRIPGPKSIGAIKGEMLYNKNDYSTLYNLLGTEDTPAVFTGNEGTLAASYTYRGFVSMIGEIAGDGQKETTISFEFQPNGQPTLA